MDAKTRYFLRQIQRDITGADSALMLDDVAAALISIRDVSSCIVQMFRGYDSSEEIWADETFTSQAR